MESSDSRMKMWSAEEDKLLVDCLVTLRIEQKYMADNSFKNGFANALQEMMEAKQPGCGIKATPHITSRLKTLKRLWQMAYDMVYGPNIFGFSWDPDTKFVTADPVVWEEYLKAHPRASHFRTKTLPNFDGLTFVWGKDRAVGEEIRSPVGMEDDVNLEDDGLLETPSIVPVDSDFSPTQPDIGFTQIPPSETSACAEKKRRLNHSEVMAEALRDTVTALDKTMVTVFEKLGNRMSTQERQTELDAKGDDLFMELLQLEDLTFNGRNLAHMKIIACDKFLRSFYKMLIEFKTSWIQTLLQQ